jgi:ABC-type spermidine/putrescine transport system permease subunit II
VSESHHCHQETEFEVKNIKSLTVVFFVYPIAIAITITFTAQQTSREWKQIDQSSPPQRAFISSGELLMHDYVPEALHYWPTT